MKTKLAMLLTLAGLLSGCWSGGGSGATYLETVKYPDGRTKEVRLVVEQPENPLQGSFLEYTTNGFYAATGAAQDRAGIDKEAERGKSKRAAFMWCGITIILGGIYLMLGNIPILGMSNWKSNWIGLGIIALGLAGFVAIYLAEDSAKYVGWAMLVVIPAGAIFLGLLAWNYFNRKKT